MKVVAEQIWPKSGAPKSIADVEVLPADILYTPGSKHVGLATGHAMFTMTMPRIPSDDSIHAYYARVGVIKTPIDGPDPHWGIVRRWKNWGAGASGTAT